MKKSNKTTFLTKPLQWPAITAALALVVATGIGVLIHSRSASAATSPKVALIYGDSLTWESYGSIMQNFAGKTGWNPVIHSFPATGPCTWNGWLSQDIATYHPSVIVITTAGNTYNPDVYGAGG